VTSGPRLRAFIGLGSNLGDRLARIERAVDLLAETGDVVRASSVYETEPVGGPEQGAYLNVVVELMTPDSPRALLERCRGLEEDAGRVRTVRFGPRTLDADVLLVGGEYVDEPDLVVPHPEMYRRRFVLVPLGELAPELVPRGALDSAVGEVTRVGTLTRFATSVTEADH
jgi:2-amino-4-hydroxy-6-hydroxymethyldihydropteridine diphosphokinase